MDVREVMTAEPVRSYTTVIRRWVQSICHGVIFGIQYAICGNKHVDRSLDGITGDALITFDCTESQYEKFKELIMDLYPDACKFDYQFETRSTEE